MGGEDRVSCKCLQQKENQSQSSIWKKKDEKYGSNMGISSIHIHEASLDVIKTWILQQIKVFQNYFLHTFFMLYNCQKWKEEVILDLCM